MVDRCGEEGEKGLSPLKMQDLHEVIQEVVEKGLSRHSDG